MASTLPGGSRVIPAGMPCSCGPWAGEPHRLVQERRAPAAARKLAGSRKNPARNDGVALVRLTLIAPAGCRVAAGQLQAPGPPMPPTRRGDKAYDRSVQPVLPSQPAGRGGLQRSAARPPELRQQKL